ncbi:MAG: hypothetical protein B1H40_02285 [Candidatus Latescibacteria bacterium 4484_181]|nr:MAG: hypothetical protein B1H40_02285 [Candidatus Latescibacteria bacterium 4484_181]RKY69630.1 MAG: hypothetical protein DRQ02_00495 [Candidatus Latescibacterota bacterium]RKY73932.1 MAG: hypothetical protein DRQ24_01195 [Candidatus Latescibacterota bacterium]
MEIPGFNRHDAELCTLIVRRIQNGRELICQPARGLQFKGCDKNPQGLEKLAFFTYAPGENSSQGWAQKIP